MDTDERRRTRHDMLRAFHSRAADLPCRPTPGVMIERLETAERRQPVGSAAGKLRDDRSKRKKNRTASLLRRVGKAVRAVAETIGKGRWVRR